MKNSFENSFKLAFLLKLFVVSKGKLYKLYPHITLGNNPAIARFIERNNHHVKSNVALSNLLDLLLDNPKNDFNFARKN